MHCLPRVGRAILALAVAAALAGCVELLPQGQTTVKSPWRSYEEAKTAIDRIVPGRTTVAELNSAGIDPYNNANVQILSYSDILLRFPVAGLIAQEHLDSGLRTCLYAGKACTGYAIAIKETTHDRTGEFWSDTFRFKRVVDTVGWSFNALILIVDGRVVYTLYAGQPIIHEQEVTRQPLGPLQNWGDSIPLGFR